MDRCEILMDQIGAVYVKSDRMAALYVTRRVSFCWPHVEPASAFKMESLCRALRAMSSTWAQKVRVGSKVTPRILGRFSIGRLVLFSGIVS